MSSGATAERAFRHRRGCYIQSTGKINPTYLQRPHFYREGEPCLFIYFFSPKGKSDPWGWGKAIRSHGALSRSISMQSKDYSSLLGQRTNVRLIDFWLFGARQSFFSPQKFLTSPAENSSWTLAIWRKHTGARWWWIQEEEPSILWRRPLEIILNRDIQAKKDISHPLLWTANHMLGKLLPNHVHQTTYLAARRASGQRPRSFR